MRTVCDKELKSLVETPDAVRTQARTKIHDDNFNGKDDPLRERRRMG